MKRIIYFFFVLNCFLSAPALCSSEFIRSNAEKSCDAEECEISIYIENNKRLCTKIVSNVSVSGAYVKNSISNSDFFLAARHGFEKCAAAIFFGVYEHEIDIVSNGIGKYFELTARGRAALKTDEIDSRAMGCVAAGKKLKFVHAEIESDDSGASGVIFRIEGCGRHIDAHVPLVSKAESYITLSYSSYVVDNP